MSIDAGRAEFERAIAVPRETLERLDSHRRLLAEWSGRANLVGPKELELYWTRHALDCAQLLRLAPTAKRWVDLGSGAGFPGIVIACMIADQPDSIVHLVESTGKKARFLEEAVREIGLPKGFQRPCRGFRGGRGAL